MYNPKQILFDLILNEEVLLFVGAGMSCYAGYPSGSELAKKIYQGLPKDQKNQIPFNEDNINLSKISEDIFNLHGNKDYLFRELKEIFEKEPKTTKIHDLLARIPIFKNILTTNYDCLFEKTHNNLEVIRKSTDYPIVDLNKQLLFKIHGDLSEPNKIILASSDYNKYFSESEGETVFWNAVKDRLASHHILFIGYGLEDFNINTILDKLSKELGKSRKTQYIVKRTLDKSLGLRIKRDNII